MGSCRAPESWSLLCLLLPMGIQAVECVELPLIEPHQAPSDQYQAGSTEIRLLLSPGEVAVACSAPAHAGNRAAATYAMTRVGLSSAGIEVRPGLSIHSLGGKSPPVTAALATLAEDSDIRFAYPVYRTQPDGPRLVPTDEIVAEFSPDLPFSEIERVAQRYGTVIARKVTETREQFVLRLLDPKSCNPVQTANALRYHPAVAWAEPNFYHEITLGALPDDPLFPVQWHLRNTGQSGGVPGADVAATAAWEITSGSAEIVVAVIDNGIQLDHPDLAGAVFENPRERADGLDNDGNGYVDDLHGWDFRDSDNDPGPASGADRHGTAVAGIIAAHANNGTGGAGVAYGIRLLPIRIARGDTDFASSTQIAEAFRYAARMADILSNSWTGGGRSEVMVSALRQALREGRQGLGCPVLFASGNGAGGWVRVELIVQQAGRHTYRWEYAKDGSVSQLRDTVWIDNVTFPDGTHVNFNDLVPPALPTGWMGGGQRPWVSVTDGVYARGGTGASLRAGEISHGQVSWVSVTRDDPPGLLVFYAWVSSERRYDIFRVYVDGVIRHEDSGGGAQETVAPPACWPETIAVGAATHFDDRAWYSQYGPQLDVVAPSSGGSAGIWTTDLVGTAGYSAQDYTTFGGTSAACPLAAGCVALLLSHRPTLSATDVRTLLRQSADRIGPYPYDSEGRNDFFGYGRVNAARLLATPLSATAPTADTDGDGIPDEHEANPPAAGQTNLYLPDSDGDGLPDGVEDANASGRHDAGETSARQWDSDADRVDDGVEVRILATDPLDPATPGVLPDQDADGLPDTHDPDPTRADTDGDRYGDAYEAALLGPAAAGDPQCVPSLGDITNDGGLTNFDGLVIQAFWLGKPVPSGIDPGRADLNRDGHITNFDALASQVWFLSEVLLLPTTLSR